MTAKTYALISFIEWLQTTQETAIRQAQVLDRAGLDSVARSARALAAECQERMTLIDRAVDEQARRPKLVP